MDVDNSSTRMTRTKLEECFLCRFQSSMGCIDLNAISECPLDTSNRGGGREDGNGFSVNVCSYVGGKVDALRRKETYF